MKKKEMVFLNSPIKSNKEDFIGVDGYVRKIDYAIDNGARMIAVTSEFGGGKSSVTNLYMNELNNNKVECILINMWNQVDGDSEDQLHKHFLYQLSSKLDSSKSYISKVLSRNYGLLDLDVDISNFSKIIFVLILFFLILTIFIPKQYIVSFVGDIENVGTKIDYIRFFLAIIFISFLLFILNKSMGLVFSSKNSEQSRKLDSVDYYFIYNKIISKYKDKKIVIIIEDLDRTSNMLNVSKFLTEINKYYTSDSKKVYFVFNIMPESKMLEEIKKNEKENNKAKEGTFEDIRKMNNLNFEKIFDYVIRIPQINYIDYYVVMENILDQHDDNLTSFLNRNSISKNEVKRSLAWLIKGKKISVRILKDRLNTTFNLYESLKENHESKTVDFQKCAIAAYVKSEYESILNGLKDDYFDKMLKCFFVNKSVEEYLEFNSALGITDKSFNDDILDLITNKLIDTSYRFYFYNTPKNTEFLDINETRVHNIIMYNEMVLKNDEKIIAEVNVAVIKESINRYLELGINLPKCVYQNLRIFEIVIKYFNDNFLLDFSNQMNNDLEFFFTDDQTMLLLPYLQNIIPIINQSDSKEFKTNFRKTLLRTNPRNFIKFKDLFIEGKLNLTDEELMLINTYEMLFSLTNVNSSSFTLSNFQKIHDKVIELIEIDKTFSFDEIESFYINYYLISKIPKIINMFLQYLIIGKKNSESLNKLFVNDEKLLLENLEEFSKLINVIDDEKLTIELMNVPVIHNQMITINLDKINKFKKVNLIFYIKLMMYNEFNEEVAYDNQYIYDEIKSRINELVAENHLEKLRRSVILKSKNLIQYKYLFELPYDRVTNDELNFKKKLDVAVNLIDRSRINKENLEDVLSYFYGLNNDKANVETIYEYIYEFKDFTLIHEFLMSINQDEIPFAILSKKKQNDYIRILLKNLKLNNLQRLLLIKKLNISNVEVEKKFTKKELDDNSFMEIYVQLINADKNCDPIGTTLDNILKSSKYYIFNEKIEKKLLKKGHYKKAIWSRTMRNKKFEYPYSVFNQKLEDDLMLMFNSNSFLNIKLYMFKNIAFVNHMVELNNFDRLNKENIKELSNYRQTQVLLEFVSKKLSKLELTNYFASIKEFKDFSAAEFATNVYTKGTIIANDVVYNNLHDKVIDSNLKRRLTVYKNKNNL